MKILVSWSSGKDSAWTLHLLRRQYGHAVAGLLTTTNQAFDRVAMHAVRREVLEAQARAARLPLHVIPLPWPCSNDDYERLMRQAVADAVAEGFTHVAFGDLFLEDVRRYREERLAGTGLEPMFPLWGLPTDRLAHEMIAGGLRAVISTVDPSKVDASFAGRDYDAALLAALPSSADPCGERGEFHTCVRDGPMFHAPLRLSVGETVHRDGFVFTDLALVQDVAGLP